MLSLLLVLSLGLAEPGEPPATSDGETAGTVDWNAEFGLPPRVRDPGTGEYPVEPYVVDDANAGATPFTGDSMAQAFHGRAGIGRIADRFVELSVNDRRLAATFAATDVVRFRRIIFEQFCYILNAGCRYTGRDMRSSHQNVGAQRGDLNAIVENVQQAMREEGVAFRAQNRFLAKLAVMERDVVVR